MHRSNKNASRNRHMRITTLVAITMMVIKSSGNSDRIPVIVVVIAIVRTANFRINNSKNP